MSRIIRFLAAALLATTAVGCKSSSPAPAPHAPPLGASNGGSTLQGGTAATGAQTNSLYAAYLQMPIVGSCLTQTSGGLCLEVRVPAGTSAQALSPFLQATCSSQGSYSAGQPCPQANRSGGCYGQSPATAQTPNGSFSVGYAYSPSTPDCQAGQTLVND